MSERSDIKVGFACNNRCVFCAQGEKRRDVGCVEPQVIVDHMRRAFAPGRGLVLTGGEPTIRRDLVALVRRARAIGYRQIQIQTNGRMLHYERAVRRLIAAGVTEFSPALHGPSPEIHDALTRAGGSFAQTVAGIANAIACGAAVVTNTVACLGNLEHLKATIEVLGSLGVCHAQIALVHPVGTASARFDEVVPRISDAAHSIAGAVHRGRALGIHMVVEAIPPCLLRGLETAIVEDDIPETTVVDLDGAAFAFSDWRRSEGKAKGPPCERCERADRCEGPWREYPERFGWDEYRPYLASD